jgi:putative endonuclease
MYSVYILQSLKTKKYYIGQTDSLARRIHQHNSGYSKSTKHGIPWEMVYHQEFDSRAEAVQFEIKLKKMKSSKYLLDLISGGASR